VLIQHTASAERSNLLPSFLPCPCSPVASLVLVLPCPPGELSRLRGATQLPGLAQVSSDATRSGKLGTGEQLGLGVGLRGCPVNTPF